MKNGNQSSVSGRIVALAIAFAMSVPFAVTVFDPELRPSSPGEYGPLTEAVPAQGVGMATVSESNIASGWVWIEKPATPGFIRVSSEGPFNTPFVPAVWTTSIITIDQPVTGTPRYRF